MAPWLPLLPLGIWVAANNQIWTNWNNRQRRCSANAQGRMGQSAAMVTVQLAAGFGKLGALGLLLDFTRPPPGWCRRGRTGAHCRNGCAPLAQVAWAQHLRRYREFPLVNTPHAFVVALQDSLMVQLLGMLATAELMGHCGLVVRVLKLPAALLGQAVSQVLYRDLAEAHARARACGPAEKGAAGVVGTGDCAFLIIMAWGGPLFAFAFGEQWRDAGQIAATLTPSFFCMFLAAPCFMVPMVLSRQRQSLLFALLGVVVNLGSLGVVYWAGENAHQVFRLLSVTVSIYYIIYMVWVFRLCRHLEQNHAHG
jgi:hypothetical protein